MRYAILSADRCPLLNINSIGYGRHPSVTRWGPGRRNLYIIHYVLSGKGYFNSAPVTAGQGFLITPGMMEEYHSDPSEPWDFLWVISDDDRMAEIFRSYQADPRTNVFSYSCAAAVHAARDRLLAEANSAWSSYETLEVFLNLYKHQMQDGGHLRRSSHPDMYVESALNYIKSNLSSGITVAELTQILGVSQPYLYRVFRERFGKSPKQYIDDCRIACAKSLLAETEMTVTQVAASAGFGDVLSFSKFFAAKTGVSPLKYRKNPF